MLTPQTDSVNCLALVRCQSIIVKCIFLFYLLLVFLLPYRIYGEIKLCIVLLCLSVYVFLWALLPDSNKWIGFTIVLSGLGAVQKGHKEVRLNNYTADLVGSLSEGACGYAPKVAD